MEPQNYLIQNESEHPLTYGELQNRINAIYKLMPMETKSFVSCIEEKIKGEDLSKIYIKGKKFSVKTQEEKVLLTMLFYLRDIDAQLHILNYINTAEFNNKKKLNYDKNFYMCEELSDYTTLTPHSLVLKYMNSLGYDKLYSIFKKFFKIYADDFIENLIAKNKIFEQMLKKETSF